MNSEKKEGFKNKIYENIQLSFIKYKNSCKDLTEFRNSVKNDLFLHLTSEEKNIFDTIIYYYNKQIDFYWSLIKEEKMNKS